MSSKPDFIRKKFGPLREKTLRNALAHRIVKEFPRIGGPRICQICADMILEVISKHMRSQEHLTHGQALWMAVSANNPPAHRQRIADTELVPVLLDLSTAEDVQQRIDRRPTPERLLHKALRLCQQAHGCDPKMGLRCISLRLLTCGYVRHLLVVRIAQNAVDFSVFKGVGSQILGDRRLA